MTSRQVGGLFEKGKPVERQGRKVSDLRGKTYDSGAAKVDYWGFLCLFFI